MKVVVAAGGRFHALHLAHQLEKRNALKKLYTGSYTKADESYINKKLIEKNYSFKYLSTLFQKLRFYKFLDKSKLHVITDKLFDNWLSGRIEQDGEFDIFVGWANYFLSSYEKIKKTGAKIIVESGSTHILEQQKLLQEEYERFGLKSPPICKENLEKILREYEVADYIMTPSGFTQGTFLKHGVDFKKMLRVPYGVNLDFFKQNKIVRKTKKFRVISVGMMCLRKGIPYLLQAWKKLNLPIESTELLLVGNVMADLKHFLKDFKLPENVVFYGSTDRKTLAHLYSQSSVFVLPSIEEGLSMTIAEAMANELPVICTTNTGGEDLIDDGTEGFIVPIRNIDSLAEKILYCYQNIEKSEYMGSLGSNKIDSFSWDVYGENVYETYKKII